jgi:hypothetical protein
VIGLKALRQLREPLSTLRIKLRMPSQCRSGVPNREEIAGGTPVGAVPDPVAPADILASASLFAVGSAIFAILRCRICKRVSIGMIGSGFAFSCSFLTVSARTTSFKIRFDMHLLSALLLSICCLGAVCAAQGSTSTYYYGPVSPSNCVSYGNWRSQPQPTGTWSFESFVNSGCEKHEPTAGVRGWLAQGGAASATQTTLNGTRDGLKERVRQAFRNMKIIVGNYNATLQDVTSVVCMTYDIVVVRPIVNEVQAEAEFWGPQKDWTNPVYPPRTIVGSIQFNGLDCLSANGTVYNGGRGSAGQAACDQPTDQAIGDIIEIDFSFAYPRRAALQFPYTSLAAISSAPAMALSSLVAVLGTSMHK